MEPDRYWLLYSGLLFVFLGSDAGREFCRRASCILLACFYAALALAAAALAKLLWGMSSLLLKIENAYMDGQKSRTAAKARDEAPSVPGENDP